MSDSYDDYELKMQLAEYAWEQALEEKQEPVAFCTYPKCQTTAGCAGVCARQNTTQQPRQWVGLTDEEINSVRHKRDWTAPWTDETFARAIEAKLREKNT